MILCWYFLKWKLIDYYVCWSLIVDVEGNIQNQKTKSMNSRTACSNWSMGHNIFLIYESMVWVTVEASHHLPLYHFQSPWSWDNRRNQIALTVSKAHWQADHSYLILAFSSMTATKQWQPMQTGSWFHRAGPWKLKVLPPVLLLHTVGMTSKPGVWKKCYVGIVWNYEMIRDYLRPFM